MSTNKNLENLEQKIRGDMTEAMRAKDVLRLATLRGLLASFTNEMIAKKTEKLKDEEVIAIISRAAKQRKDSIEQFKKGGREDLVKNEKAELAILESYLPEMMGKDEIKKIALKKQKELGVSDKSKAGVLTGALMKDLRGKADGADVKAVVDELLK